MQENQTFVGTSSQVEAPTFQIGKLGAYTEEKIGYAIIGITALGTETEARMLLKNNRDDYRKTCNDACTEHIDAVKGTPTQNGQGKMVRVGGLEAELRKIDTAIFGDGDKIKACSSKAFPALNAKRQAILEQIAQHKAKAKEITDGVKTRNADVLAFNKVINGVAEYNKMVVKESLIGFLGRQLQPQIPAINVKKIA